MTLRPCPSCARHVRASEGSCPFCSTTLASETTAAAIPGRLSRAALFTFRTTVAAAALVGCGPTATPPPETTIAQPYGAPPNPDWIPPTTVAPPPTTTTDPDPGGAVPAYGATPPPPPTSDTAPPPTSEAHHHAHHTPPPDPGTTSPAYGAPASAYGGAPFDGPGGL